MHKCQKSISLRCRHSNRSRKKKVTATAKPHVDGKEFINACRNITEFKCLKGMERCVYKRAVDRPI